MARATIRAASARQAVTPSPTATAVPTATGTTAAGSVRGRAPAIQVSTRTYGRLGNWSKSGLRLFTYASRPSWASSVW